MSNLSEEEIISSINALILYASCQKDSGEKYKKVAVDNIDIQALNGILDLYNKEKEKNNYARLEKEALLESCISKDKIRNRITEYIKIRDTKVNYCSILYFKYDFLIKKLQGLLEEY